MESVKKIVATTDKSLEPNSKWNKLEKESDIYLPQLPESFIQAYIKAYNEGKPITEIDLEGQYLKDKSFHIHTRMDNTVIIHQSKMYSRDKVKQICYNLIDAFNTHPSQQIKGFNTDKWLQDNL